MVIETGAKDETNSGNTGAGIDRIYRNAFDLRSAILAQMERSAVVSPPSVATPPSARHAGGKRAAALARSRQPAQPRSRGPKQSGKRALRTLLKPLKPIVRPLLSRIRSSMLEQWQFEVRTARADLRYLVEANQERLDRIERSLQGVKGSALRQDVRDIAAGQRALQQLVEATQQAQEVQIAGLQKTLSATFDPMSQLNVRMDMVEHLLGGVARRSALYLGSGEALVHAQAGYVVCSTQEHALLAYLLETGDLERGTRLLIERFLKTGNVFVDAGANIGLHTIAAARTMQGAGRIVAVEPFEPTARLLQKSVALNGFSEMVQIERVALSNHDGRQVLHLGATSAHHSLYPLAKPGSATDAPVEVPLTTLDSIMAPDFHVDLIKIDVEGAEMDVIEGAHDTLTLNPDVALIVEFGPSHMIRTGHHPEDWLDAFKRLGFVYQVINAESGALEEWTFDRLARIESANLFFARPGSSAWERVRGK